MPAAPASPPRLNHAATLPYPPSANVLWRNVNGRMVLSREGRQYKARVRDLLPGVRPLTCDVAVRIDVYRPIRSGDLDNRLKAVLDAVRGLLFVDDRQVVEIHARRHDDKAAPRVEIAVRAKGGGRG